MNKPSKRTRPESTEVDSSAASFVLGEQKVLSSNYRDLGPPTQVGRRFVTHLLESDKCLASIMEILAAEPGKTGLHDFSLEIDTFELIRRDPCLGNMLLRFPATLVPLLEDSIVEAQRLVFNRLKEIYKSNSSSFTAPFIKGERNTRIHARLTHLPPNSSHCKPFISALNSNDVGKIIQITGTVVRTSSVQMYESQRAYKCCDKNCGHKFIVKADLEEFNNSLNVPTRCPMSECPGTTFEVIPHEATRSDYQEIKIQESASNRFSNSKAGRIPKALLVKLQHDLVDKCQPGDDVVIVGSLMAHWKSSLPSMSDCEVGTTIVAHSLRVVHGGLFGDGSSSSWERIFDEAPQMDNDDEDVNTNGAQSNRRSLVREDILKEFTDFWIQHKHRPIATRNLICQAVCPTLYGLSMIKTALLLTLIGGSTTCLNFESDNIIDRTRVHDATDEDTHEYDQPRVFSLAKDESSEFRDASANDTGNMNEEKGYTGLKKSSSSVQTRRREQSHIFLIGDPGTGKSQFLRFAAALCPRGVMASGSSGTTSAGLTCAAVRESSGKEFTLEAGALVLADRGVCAIDEFNCISKDDRTSIHEALEQQTLSIAKAGIICKLNCRATVVAVSNPKGGIFDPDRSFMDNVGLGAPLLSRFDLIFKLIDTSDSIKDDNVATFLLNRAIAGSGYECSKKVSEDAKEVWSMDKLRAYIATVKSRFHPIVTDVAAQLLQKHYENCRQLGDCMAIPVTVRYFESLIRLSQAHARLMFRDTVTLDDAVAVILLMECSAYSTSECNFRSNQYFFYKDPMSTVFPEDHEADLGFLHEKFHLLNQYSMKEYISAEEISILSKMSMSEAVESEPVEIDSTTAFKTDPWTDYKNKKYEVVDHYGRMSQAPSSRGSQTKRSSDNDE